MAKFSLRSFMLGTTATSAIVILILVSLFAVVVKKSPTSAPTKTQTQKTPLHSKYASVEGFCDAGSCPMMP